MNGRMPWLRHFALFVVFVTALVRPAVAGAFVSVPDAGSQARVGAFELVAATLVGPASAATCGLHEGIGAAYDENASGYRFAAGGLPRLPRSVGAAANITTRSRIGESSYAVRLAESLSQGAQRDVDLLLGQVRAGNMNPGIGTRALGNGFFELRGANAGRVIVKQTSGGAFDIVGKFQGQVRGDSQNSTLIQRLMEDYDDR